MATASNNPLSDFPPYAAHRLSYSFDPNLPPAPPPKPSSQVVSRQGTPASNQSLPPPTLGWQRGHTQAAESQLDEDQARVRGAVERLQDPGDRWLPRLLQDKSKQDLAEVLGKLELMVALAHSHSTIHPSTTASQEPLLDALDENMSLASHLNELDARLVHLRTSTQAQLLSAHALERQWRQKQSDMDRALSPLSPSSLYQGLTQGVQEQEMVCRALEESFLEGDSGVASEREITEWVKRYRDAKKLYYSRRERKERWDEGRVGGWR